MHLTGWEETLDAPSQAPTATTGAKPAPEELLLPAQSHRRRRGTSIPGRPVGARARVSPSGRQPTGPQSPRSAARPLGPSEGLGGEGGGVSRGVTADVAARPGRRRRRRRCCSRGTGEQGSGARETSAKMAAPARAGECA